MKFIVCLAKFWVSFGNFICYGQIANLVFATFCKNFGQIRIKTSGHTDWFFPYDGFFSFPISWLIFKKLKLVASRDVTFFHVFAHGVQWQWTVGNFQSIQPNTHGALKCKLPLFKFAFQLFFALKVSSISLRFSLAKLSVVSSVQIRLQKFYSWLNRTMDTSWLLSRLKILVNWTSAQSLLKQKYFMSSLNFKRDIAREVCPFCRNCSLRESLCNFEHWII